MYRIVFGSNGYINALNIQNSGTVDWSFTVENLPSGTFINTSATVLSGDQSALALLSDNGLTVVGNLAGGTPTKRWNKAQPSSSVTFSTAPIFANNRYLHCPHFPFFLQGLMYV